MIINMNPFLDDSTKNFKGAKRNEAQFKKLERLLALAKKLKDQESETFDVDYSVSEISEKEFR